MKLSIRSFLIAYALLPICCCTTFFVESTVAATAATNSALSVLKTLDYRYFVAGGTCAAISHGITTPIDVIKTKKQSDPTKYSQMNMVQTAVDIVATDGTNALLGGLGPTVIGYGIEGAMKFGVYEICKPIFRSLFTDMSAATTTTTPAVAYLLASVVAGAVAAVLLCPMESTRIRMVTDPSYASKGLLSALSRMIQEDGPFASFAQGLFAMLSKQVPYTLGKQVSFDIFAGMLYTILHNASKSGITISDTQSKWIVSIVAAFLASIIACIFSQPGDMILTETYKKSPSPSSSKSSAKVSGKGPAVVAATLSPSFIDVIRTIYGRDGLVSFFTGTGARIVHVGLIITSQLVIYDIVKQLLGLPATGSH